MKFKGTDTCIEDYRRRQHALISYLAATVPDTKERARQISDWMRENTPFEPHEQMQNLRRAIYGDERH